MRTASLVVALILALAVIDADTLDDFYSRTIKERNVPSMSLAVVKNGAVVKAGAYGTADLERHIGARPGRAATSDKKNLRVAARITVITRV